MGMGRRKEPGVEPKSNGICLYMFYPPQRVRTGWGNVGIRDPGFMAGIRRN